MDGLLFDKLTRALASGITRRNVMRGLAGGTAVGVAGTVGLASTVAADATFELVGTPKIVLRNRGLFVRVELPAPSPCILEFGDSKELGSEVKSTEISATHEIPLRNLTPGTVYFFRIVLETDAGPLTTRIYKFTAPVCQPGTVQCGGTCVPECGPNAALDQSSCTCTCNPGYAHCGADSATGCGTQLGTADNCQQCGDRCDDGNACTTNTCDPVAGCVTSNSVDGTPCGSSGVCVNGVCQDCVSGGSCSTDSDCCDDESCCNGACTQKDKFLEDANNCGGCGIVCPSGPCATASCVAGICQSTPLADGEACDDGNPCTSDTHCMGGACAGTPADDGTACDDGVCAEGTCTTCTAGQTCGADSDCCTDEVCCAGTCRGKAEFADDVQNCGGCGKECKPSDNPCETVICKDGSCAVEDVKNGDSCQSDNPCMEESTCNDGVCNGTPKPDDTECGAAGTCQQGTCVEPQAFQAAALGTIFSDDFEGGSLAKWSAATGVTVQSGIVAAGSFAARAVGKSTVAYARRTLGAAQQEIFFRIRFQILGQGQNSVYLMRTFRSASSPLLSLFVTSSGRLATFNNVTGATLTSATTITRNTWHEIQFRVRVNGTQSLGTVWLNGVKINDISRTTNLGATGIALAQIGDNVARRTFDVAFDDVAICTGGLCPALPPGISTAPGATDSVLLATYALNSSRSAGGDWSRIFYRPRQFKTGLVVDDPSWGPQRVDSSGTYDGWDLYATFNDGLQRYETRADWTMLEMNRDATLAIVWRGGGTVPAWLAGWTMSGSVKINGVSFPTYRKRFGRGKVSLGAVYNPTDNPSTGRDTYWVLFAEADALRSPAPSVPAGLQAPAPNATCPTWVHDKYTAKGPDGMSYPTWHAQIDPVYWCYHRHEHGSNPKWFGGGKKPVFGYTAAMHGMEEPHTGFKNFVLDSQDGTRWMVTHHFGTAGLGRACNRFHTVDIAVRSIATGELLADLHFMGDFGKAVVNQTEVPLTPPACPTQAADAADSSGVRKLPSQADGAVGYEPWRVDLSKTLFGFIASFTVNNPDAIVICNNSTCDQPVSTGSSGTFRFFTPNGDAKGTRFAIVAGLYTGEFFTDVYGRTIVDRGAHGAVRQFIKPGARMQVLSPDIEYYDLYAWGRKFVSSPNGNGPTSREGSIQPPN